MISKLFVVVDIGLPLAGVTVKKIDVTAQTVISFQARMGIRARKADPENALAHSDGNVFESEIAGKPGTFYDEPDRFTRWTAILDEEQRDTTVRGRGRLDEHSGEDDPGHGSPEAEAVKLRWQSDAHDDLDSLRCLLRREGGGSLGALKKGRQPLPFGRGSVT